MLRAWLVNPDLGDMEIEEKFKTIDEENRKDKYVTVPEQKIDNH